MEVSGLVFRSFPSAGIDSASFLPAGSRFSGYLIRPIKFSNNSAFLNNGHIDYYYHSSTIRCGTGSGPSASKKKLKKKMKLLKGLSEDLTVFSDMGFALPPDHGLAAQVKGKMISDAAELLLAQLEKLKAEEKELKRKKKEDKAKLKAERMQKRVEAEAASSSSSSSESSDGECGDVIDMSRLKTTESPLAQPLPQEGKPAIVINTLPSILMTQIHKEDNTTSQIVEQEYCTSCTSSLLGGDGCNEGTSNLLVRGRAVTGSEKKIEVCMGGKCKKSGAPALLEEFQRMVGVEGSVVGCKCMGKCRDGPNVRVLNHLDSPQPDDSVRATPPSNLPLCIGVGLEDVGLILSNFFGQAQSDLAAAP